MEPSCHFYFILFLLVIAAPYISVSLHERHTSTNNVTAVHTAQKEFNGECSHTSICLWN